MFNKIINLTLILTLLFSFSAISMDIQHEKKIKVLITAIDSKNNTVQLRENKHEKTYNYAMIPRDNVYYRNNKPLSLAKLPLNNVYYIRVGFYSDEDFKQDIGTIYYIGTIPYPF